MIDSVPPVVIVLRDECECVRRRVMIANRRIPASILIAAKQGARHSDDFGFHFANARKHILRRTMGTRQNSFMQLPESNYRVQWISVCRDRVDIAHHRLELDVGMIGINAARHAT